MSYTTTATQLTADLQAWLEDDDAEFQGSIPEIINLGELRLIRDLDLSIFYSVDTAATTQSQAEVAKPVGYTADELGAQSIYYTVANVTTFLELRSIDWIREYLTATEAAPLYYAEPDQTNFVVAPLPDGVYTLNIRHLNRPAPLVVTTNENNWLSDNAGDILFKACLAESEKFLKSDDRIPIWEQDYMTSLPSTKRELYELMGTRYPELRAFPLGANQ